MLVQAVAAALSRSLLAPTIARFGQKTTMLMVITTCEAHEVIVSSWCRQHESVTNRSMSLLRVRNVAAALSECQKPAVGVARRLAWLMTYKQPAHEYFMKTKRGNLFKGGECFQQPLRAAQRLEAWAMASLVQDSAVAAALDISLIGLEAAILALAGQQRTALAVLTQCTCNRLLVW